MTEHVILVAMVVEAPSRREAEAELHRAMGLEKLQLQNVAIPAVYVDSWWVAEDDRRDGSDNDSAVFCGPGFQRVARTAVEQAGLQHEKPGWYRRPGRLRPGWPEDLTSISGT